MIYHFGECTLDDSALLCSVVGKPFDLRPKCPHVPLPPGASEPRGIS